MKFLILCVLLVNFPEISGQNSIIRQDNGIGEIVHKIEQFFTFLCTRCKEIVLYVDGAIDNQSLKKDANALCDSLLGFSEVTEKVCKSVGTTPEWNWPGMELYRNGTGPEWNRPVMELPGMELTGMELTGMELTVYAHVFRAATRAEFHSGQFHSGQFHSVEDILGEVYAQLKKFEPDHTACAHLHLCDSCAIDTQLTTTTKRPTKRRENEEIDTAKLLHGIAKIHHLAFSLSTNFTDPLFFYYGQK
ncbi:unnamed protein product [Caenorhabditis sp. 36 PRJEB53466]|nr:unnamed protein product [Caenorhabditis sp. 36 PRJEB53466]